MRSIHDALRAAFEHLSDPAQEELTRLFKDEELLSRLSTRLLVFARQGVPDQHPPPHFSAEQTPPLAEAFLPFRAAVAAWHDAPDSPDAAARFADALTTAGVRSVLVLLGQRFTPGSIADARALPPSREKLLATAAKPNSPGDPLSVAGRALAKHAARCTGSFWGSVTGSAAEKSAAAERLLVRILDEATWWNVFGHFAHGDVFEARVPSGHGARWGHGGEEFVGFLEPFDEG